ncbi:MAG: allene oxide cyclase family protein [Steroidobacteraceae bacterium]
MRAATSVTALVVLLAGGHAMAAQSITLVERAVTNKVVPVGAKDDSRGNLLVFANPVYDKMNRIQVGSDQGFCIRVVTAKSWECFWTLILKGGQITTEGPFYDKGDSVLTITGGTGKYAGAKGKLLLHARNPQSTSYRFKYELL